MFFYGGNDSSNMVLRTDTTSFAEYTRLRNLAPESIALLAPGTAVNNGATRASPARLGGVIPIAPKFTVSPENNAFTYALHPVMTEVQSLFGAGRLAILANAGPLVVPLTRAEYTSNSKPRPQALGSHNDQQSTWQALGPEGVKIGWGGHIGDMIASPEHQPDLHQHLGVGQRGVLGRPDDVPVQRRRRRLDPDRRHQRHAVQLDDGGDDPALDHHVRQPAPVRQGVLVDHQPLDHGAGDLPVRLQRLDGGGPDAVQRAVDRQQREQRPGAADPDRGPRDRRAQRDRRQAADLLRLDGRLRHPRRPEHEPGRSAWRGSRTPSATSTR